VLTEDPAEVLPDFAVRMLGTEHDGHGEAVDTGAGAWSDGTVDGRWIERKDARLAQWERR
jgi:hypothetical protein